MSLINLPATILDSAGVAVPDNFMGKSLTGLLENNGNKNVEWEDEIYTQISESKTARSIRTPKWKYAVASDENPWLTGEAAEYYEEFLYDLENDPHEQNNLVKDKNLEAERENLSQIMIKHMNRAGEKTPVIRQM